MKILKVLILVLGVSFISFDNSHSSSLEDLESLQYLAWSDEPDIRPSGVVKYDKSKAFDGYNLYTDDVKNIFLMDMKGRILYRWKLPYTIGSWQYVRLLNDGSIVAVSFGMGLAKFDRNSKFIWATPILAHHDIEVLPDGTFLVPANEPPVLYDNKCVLFDSIVRISKDGRILNKWSTHELLKGLQKMLLPSVIARNKRYDTKYKRIHDTINDMIKTSIISRIGTPHGQNQCTMSDSREWRDYYHLNSIQVLPDTILGLKDRRFQKGNWLISLRNVDLICILDKDTHQVVWAWGPGILDRQHIPRMLNNGNILVFDNGFHRSYSRLVIVDPASDKIVWEYKANPPESFDSLLSGSSQQLPNGNFFICEAEKGRAFEITPSGEIVWEFLNPVVNQAGQRKTISRMLRIPKEEVSGWLGKI